jgi:hypothetical protein
LNVAAFALALIYAWSRIDGLDDPLPSFRER